MAQIAASVELMDAKLHEINFRRTTSFPQIWWNQIPPFKSHFQRTRRLAIGIDVDCSDAGLEGIDTAGFILLLIIRPGGREG